MLFSFNFLHIFISIPKKIINFYEVTEYNKHVFKFKIIDFINNIVVGRFVYCILFFYVFYNVI